MTCIISSKSWSTAVSLCGGKRIVLVSTAGGLHHGQPTDVGHEQYLQVTFGFLGIDAVEVIRAQGLAYGPEQREQAIGAAQAQIAELRFTA